MRGDLSSGACGRADGSVDWAVVDAGTYDLHAEATAFLMGLRGRDRSPNTIRAYAGRVALFLAYCGDNGLDWREPGFLAMKRFKDRLVSQPLPGHRRGHPRLAATRSRCPPACLQPGILVPRPTRASGVSAPVRG